MNPCRITSYTYATVIGDTWNLILITDTVWSGGKNPSCFLIYSFLHELVSNPGIWFISHQNWTHDDFLATTHVTVVTVQIVTVVVMIWLGTVPGFHLWFTIPAHFNRLTNEYIRDSLIVCYNRTDYNAPGKMLQAWDKGIRTNRNLKVRC